MKPQYPLSAEAKERIRPVIADMQKAGILVKTNEATCNTPILPVKKTKYNGPQKQKKLLLI